jgi:hypothetical protein
MASLLAINGEVQQLQQCDQCCAGESTESTHNRVPARSSPQSRDLAQGSHLVSRVLDPFRRDPSITQIKWKTRGHDQAPGLHDALQQYGFHPEEPKSIMVGMQDMVFGRTNDHMAESLLQRLALGDGMQLWVAVSELNSTTLPASDGEPMM